MLDPDALEQQYDLTTNGHTLKDIRPLIQRLREAEERERQHQRELDLLDSFHKTRIAQLEREAGTTGHVNVERLTWDALIQRLRDAEERERQHRREMDTLDSFHKVRIAQLERVRVAATAAANAIEAKPPRYFGGTVTRLRKALAAVEEKQP